MRRPLLLACAAVFLLAFFAGLSFARLGGELDRPAGGDGPYYSGLAQSLAQGKGYILARSPWPEAPHLGRLPVWPFLLSLPMRVFPEAGEFAVLRISAVFFHALASALLVCLTYQFWKRLRVAAAAGVMLALYAPAYGLLSDGYPEPCWLALTLAGILLIRRGGASQFAGALVAGVAVLVRSNFVILPLTLAVAAWVWRPNRFPRAARCLGLLALFLIPSGLWVLRNYAVSGAFPVLSAMEGETFYGGNNAVTAGDWQYWGYWVFPDRIPGETPKQKLAQAMDEAELNRYYRRKGLSFLRANWGSIPKMVLGKLVRGFVPVPVVPRLTSFLGSFFRAALLGAFLLLVLRHGPADRWYSTLLWAVFLVVLVTTLVFYGSARFTFCLEPFLIPPVAAVLFGRGAGDGEGTG
ncbi:MAG: hypothetical protein K6T61_02025 [Bryobacteraceae bacterium]|nr:hypothetical protein [Bryobacteraceae bacterium]